MSNATHLSLVSLKRKAEKLSKQFKKNEVSAAQFLILNNPKYSTNSPAELLKGKIKLSEFFHAIAKSHDFSNWSSLKTARLDYVKSVVRPGEWSKTESSCYQHINTIRVFNSLFTPSQIDKVSKSYIKSIKDLKTLSFAFIDHYEHIRKEDFGSSKSEKPIRSPWYFYFFSIKKMEAEKAILAINSIEPDFEKQEKIPFYHDIDNFHSGIWGACHTDNFQKLRETETDNSIIKILDQILEIRNRPITYRDCPDCFAPVYPGTTECTGCGASLI